MANEYEGKYWKHKKQSVSNKRKIKTKFSIKLKTRCQNIIFYRLLCMLENGEALAKTECEAIQSFIVIHSTYFKIKILAMNRKRKTKARRNRESSLLQEINKLFKN